MENRYLFDQILEDLPNKMLILTGPRQVGKSTLARRIAQSFGTSQVLNWDVPTDRALILNSAWKPERGLLVLDEIHKMKGWKAFLKGAWDGRAPGQSLLITGSARMETFRQGGESLAGRYFALRLHPLSVRELVSLHGYDASAALERLLERGGFPEPCFANSSRVADRWRQQYASDLIREDVLETSRIHEIKSLQLFVELLRERVGSPIKLSNLAQMLHIAPATATRYLALLEALYVVFRVTPWHRDISRALLKEPKIYFYDTGMVIGDSGAKLENLVAGSLHKHVQYLHDVEAQAVELHTIRDKEGHEIDFVLSQKKGAKKALTHLIEVKTSQSTPSAYLHRMSQSFPDALAVQIVSELRQEAQHGLVAVRAAAPWLAELSA